MIHAWIDDFEKVSANALTREWFVSPLEYHWGDGKKLFDNMFRAEATPSAEFDKLASPDLFRMSMNVDFRAKMMVFAFMRQDIAKSYGLEIENGLLSFFQLDYLPCLSQWIFVIEGYCRKLFSVQATSNIKTGNWIVPTSGVIILDRLIQSLTEALRKYLDSVMFKSVSDRKVEHLSRHLLLHGNVENKNFFSQKNCLLLMFLLDGLVVIEMVKNKAFPAIFDYLDGEAERVERRRALYMTQIERVFSDGNLLKINVLKEHPL